MLLLLWLWRWSHARSGYCWVLELLAVPWRASQPTILLSCRAVTGSKMWSLQLGLGNLPSCTQVCMPHPALARSFLGRCSSVGPSAAALGQVHPRYIQHYAQLLCSQQHHSWSSHRTWCMAFKCMAAGVARVCSCPVAARSCSTCYLYQACFFNAPCTLHAGSCVWELLPPTNC